MELSEVGMLEQKRLVGGTWNWTPLWQEDRTPRFAGGGPDLCLCFCVDVSSASSQPRRPGSDDNR